MQRPALLLDAHRRLLEGDTTAADTLVTLLLEPLRRRLPGRDDNTFDAVIDAVFDLVKRPAAFDPAKGGLEPFLLRAAKCNLMNLRLGDRRRRRRETVAARLYQNSVELRPPAGNLLAEDPAAAHRRLLAALDPADRPVAELMRRKERRTTAYADAMGLAGRPVAEQRLAAKRAKDRVTKTRLRLKG